MDAPDTLNSAIVEELYQQGWSIKDHYFDPALIQGLRSEALQLHQNQQLNPAGIGRGTSQHHNPAIRQDLTHWIQGASNIQQEYLSVMENLRQDLNANLMLGLFDFEAHYAIYPEGAFYKRHFDSFKGSANRLVSVVTYLNETWSDTDGGQLLIYDQHQPNLIHKVAPIASTLAVFLSEQIPHEVAVTHRQRISIAGWFRCNQTL